MNWIFQYFLIVVLVLGSFASTNSWMTSADARVLARTERGAYYGRKVRSVKVIGLKRIEREAILQKIQTKKGSLLDADQISEDIQSIFSLGYFDDVAFDAELSGSDVDIQITVKERPAVSEVIFDGNEQIDSDDLYEVIDMKEWSILDIGVVRSDVEKIQKHYEEKGFYLAKVFYEVEPVKEGEVKLVYKVIDFEKVKIKKITFLNNKVFSDEQLKKIMAETQEGGLFSFISGSGSFKESGFKNDLQRLVYWYLEHGYVKFKYENPVVTVSEDKRWLYVTIHVDEGLSYDMGNVDFGGDLLFSEEELKEVIELKKGMPFKFSTRNTDIQKLTEKYQDLGYAFVNVIPNMRINDETRTVDITYNFEKGSLVHFGEIRILGNSKTHDKVIRRELRVHEGELYNGTRMRKSRERVERLGYFQPGEVIFNTVTRKGRDDVVDLEITIKERSTGTITVGAGYGSVQKFFLTAKISEINLFGRGQTLSFDAQWAADRLNKSFNLGFTDPYAFDTRWTMGFDIFYVFFNIPNRYLTRKLGFDVRFGYPITDEITGFITYKNEGLNISQVQDASLNTSLDQGVLSSVVWSVVRDVRNNRFETSGGNYQSVSLETAGFGGDKKFLKYTLNNRFYHRLFESNLVFRHNVEFGQIFDAFGGRGLPPAEKFYLGGPNNMRGFGTFLLGPTQPSSTGFLVPLGGETEFFTMFELEYPIVKEAGLKLVTFFDAGNSFAGNPLIGDEAFRLRMDYGFGVRWFSPIGPLRFEWGFPIRPKPGEDDFNFWFFIGPPF
ncbi:MAG: outer membrane protein assembly factor BamA [Bdellovibrionaceae bacterium]|nr:outer membrane protein assembly factor BamA [Pseudobdellovibrionaceae bacterium]